MTLTQRINFQKKILTVKNIQIPDDIKKNFVKDTNIENLFYNILSSLINIKEKTMEEITDVFIKNNVYFEKPIDLIIPYKYGVKELQFYSLLNDLYFYFIDPKTDLKGKYNVFLKLKLFISYMKEIKENLILKCNYLINILYIYKENGYIDLDMFKKIVYTCLPFDKNVANEALKKIKQETLGEDISIYINNISIENYKGVLTGEENVILENRNTKVKINILSKYINWRLDEFFLANFESEDYNLCICYPENTKYNFFSAEEIKESVNNFFDRMIHSAPMKQAMIIDSEASKYKYFFNNKNILKEFNENVHIVPLPFRNYDGFTDKKSFDIYIKASYKTNNEFTKIMDKYNQFFISKAHEFKHASRIYLRIYNNELGIKTPIKDVKKCKGIRSYIIKIINKTEKIINIQSKVYNPNVSENSLVDEYGDLLELSLFGYKFNILLLKSVIFILSESSWDMSPEKFYDEFSKTMLDNNTEKLENLCKEPFLKKLFEFYDFSKKEKNYKNIPITKDSKETSNNHIIERSSHYGLREINRGRKINEQISIKDIKEQIEKRKKEHENKEEGEDNNEEEDINIDANKIKSDDSDIDMD